MLMPVQRKFNKSSRTDFGRWGTSKKIKSLTKWVSFRALWIIFAVIAFFYGIFLLFKYTLFVPEYTITKVDYDLSNVKIYDDSYLNKVIFTLIKWENYRVVQWNEDSILKQLQISYPFVQSFTVTYKWPGTVFVKLSFEEPKLIVYQWNLRYAVYNEQFSQLFSGNNLGSGALSLELFSAFEAAPVSTGISLSGNMLLGAVSSGVTISSGVLVSGNKATLLSGVNQYHGALTGLFYLESFDHFMADFQTIAQAFPNAKYFKYLVGGQRMVIWLPNDRTVYINLPVDIWLQLQNYLYLKQYYSDFSKLKEIDLWSIEMDKVIVRK